MTQRRKLNKNFNNFKSSLGKKIKLILNQQKKYIAKILNKMTINRKIIIKIKQRIKNNYTEELALIYLNHFQTAYKLNNLKKIKSH